MPILSLLLTSIGSFLFLRTLTKPGSKINRHLPEIKIKFFQLSPQIQIHIKGRVIHLHHWMNFSLLFVISIIVTGGILDSIYTKGFLLGGIVQGLTYSDWKKIINKKLPVLSLL